MRATLSALIIIGAIAVVSCDERNEPDLPQVVYTLKKNIVTPNSAMYVDADNDKLAIAALSAGTYVYDIANPANPIELFHYPQRDTLYSSYVGMDGVNGLVLTVSGPGVAPGDKYPIHDIETGDRIGGASFSAGVQAVEIVSSENRFEAWRTDNSEGDGLGVSAYCYIPDSSRWRRDYCEVIPQGYFRGQQNLRGFGIRDSLVAVAESYYRIRIYNTEIGDNITTFFTTGDPQDCAWYGDYILVADKVHFTVVSIANIDTPVVVKTLTIPGADRLVQIVMDGTTAVLLDDADGIYTVDVTTPTEPKFLQSISLPEPTSVTASNGKIIASDEQLGVLIYSR